jgi:hypothetical protein
MGRLDQRMEGREGRRDGEEVERIQAKVSKVSTDVLSPLTMTDVGREADGVQ